jgi:hypothetical protein
VQCSAREEERARKRQLDLDWDLDEDVQQIEDTDLEDDLARKEEQEQHCPPSMSLSKFGLRQHQTVAAH